MPAPTAADALAALRVDIDRIDADMHALLIERGAIIERLIAVKARQGGGSAFRPGREAEMMRRIAERHTGPLPLDTVESIWRVIISTFTYVQSAYAVHADMAAGDAAMRDSARFHFGFTVPLHVHAGAAAVVAAVAAAESDLGIVPVAHEATAAGLPWWARLRDPAAPKIIARLPFIEREGHPAGLPVFVLARPSAAAGVRDVVLHAIASTRALPALEPLGATLLDAAGDGTLDYRLVAVEEARSAALSAHLAALDIASDEVGGHAHRFQFAEPAPAPLPNILRIDPYVPGKSKGPGGGKVHKLSSNETPLGPSPLALEAFGRAVTTLELYPDGAAEGLRQAIGARYGLDPERIVCGCGSDDLLHLIAQAYIGPGDEAVITEHGFLVYKIAVQAAGGTVAVAAERNHTAEVDAILAQVGPRTKIVFLANPNNPTGTYVPFEEVRRLRAGLPSQVLLVLDAAYAEYVRANDYSSGLEMVATSDNVVMTRTFSKIHGLAALRLGWCYAPAAVCDALNRIRGPFNVNGPALEAGIAAIGDSAHMARAIEHNDHWLGVVSAELGALGIAVTPSVGNFVLLTFPREAGRTAAEADAFLSRRGLILRGVGAYGLPDSLRLTIGGEEANRAVIAALRDFMTGSAPHG